MWRGDARRMISKAQVTKETLKEIRQNDANALLCLASLRQSSIIIARNIDRFFVDS